MVCVGRTMGSIVKRGASSCGMCVAVVSWALGFGDVFDEASDTVDNVGVDIVEPGDERGVRPMMESGNGELAGSGRMVGNWAKRRL